MRKVLLSSSQVSILASALIVILFTSALFLSGYAIQQRTLRDLREAIKPREVAKPFWADRFKTQTITLEDGTVVVIESEAERQNLAGEVRPSSGAGREFPPQPRALEEKQPREQVEEGEGEEKGRKSTSKATKKQIEMMEQIKAQAARKSWAVENPDPESKSKAPVSRAQRRKMIKDELQRLAHSEKPVFYQRRLW